MKTFQKSAVLVTVAMVMASWLAAAQTSPSCLSKEFPISAYSYLLFLVRDPLFALHAGFHSPYTIVSATNANQESFDNTLADCNQQLTKSIEQASADCLQFCLDQGCTVASADPSVNECIGNAADSCTGIIIPLGASFGIPVSTNFNGIECSLSQKGKLPCSCTTEETEND